MREFYIKTNLGCELIAVLQNDELFYGVTSIMIGCDTSYHDSCKEGLVNEYAIHPITKEKLDIIAVNNDMLREKALMLVPAHIKEHFDLAKMYNLRFKQVVAPYFLGVNQEKPREGVQTQFRRSVIAVVKDPKTNKYLCVDAKKRICKSFVMGGIEGDETPAEAMMREVEEETGYCDVRYTYTSMFVLHNHFYAGYKGINRYAHLYVVFGEINSLRKHEVSKEEVEKQSSLWLSRQELKDFLSVNNNIFVYQNLLDGDVAFEQDGMMMNSGELNDLKRSDIRDY